MQYLHKLMNLFYKENFNKSTTIFLLVNFALPMAKLFIKLMAIPILK